MAEHEADQLDAVHLARPRIVVVDDNDDVRRLLRVQIERLDSYDVVGEAADGLEAIEVVAALQPDVVFLDLAMPVMDGMEALPHIRQRAPGSRVIVLSSYEESAYGGKARAAGAVKYVEKGMRMNFRGIIEEALAAVCP
jgi:CheY-like chemotaxis protein